MGDRTEAAIEKEELTPPPWLTASFIQEALLRGGEGNLLVASLDVRAATAPGDNYSSTIYRVKAALSEGGERSLLVKGPPLSAEMAQTVAATGVFERETIMLAEVIPKMEALLEAAAPGRFPPLAARCPHHGTSPSEFMVLEDLAPQGFKMAARRQGLGLRHCILALRALAQFHAASAALLQHEPSVEARVGQPYQVSKGRYDSFIEAGFDLTVNATREWPDFKDILRRLGAFKKVAMQTFIDLQDPIPGGFNVITHGDLWTNNILFRYENGEPRDVRFVDLQISHVASPVMDLHYFLSSSPSENVSAQHEDLLVREYHKALSETMLLLGLQAPPLEALLADYNSHGAFALFGATRLLPLVKALAAPDIDATITGDEDGDTYLYRNPDVQRWQRRVLLEYTRRGWLPA